MHRFGIMLICLLLGFSTLAVTCYPQGEGNTKDSFHKAVLLTRNALKQLKGTGADGGAGAIHWTGTGRYDLSARMQGLNFQRPNFTRIDETFGYDPKTSSVMYESRSKANHDAPEWLRFVYDGRGRMLVMNPAEKWAIWVPGGNKDTQRKSYARMVPQVLLAEAIANRHTLRYQGPVRIEDEAIESVSYTTPENKTLTLLISKRSGFLRGIEYLVDHPLLGDTPVRWWYGDFRMVDGFGMFPFNYKLYLGSRIMKAVEISEAGSEVDAAAWAASTPDLKVPAPPEPVENDSQGSNNGIAQRPPVEEIGNNIYLIRHIRPGFHILVVRFKDHLLLVDAPAGYHELQQIPAVDWAGEKNSSAVGVRLRDLLQKRFPNHPVKYVVLTHHHSDHAGGIIPFLKKGVTVLASKETLGVLNSSLKNNFVLDSVTGSVESDFKQVEVADVHSISDGSVSVEIRNVGKNPHVEGMLVVYIPHESLLYQADLFEAFSAERDPPHSRLTVMKWFVRWLESTKLKPRKIYAIHGSGLVTEEQIEKVRRADDPSSK